MPAAPPFMPAWTDRPQAWLVMAEAPRRDEARNWLSQVLPGWRMRSFASAEAALGRGDENDVALLVTSLSLPNLDGIALARLTSARAGPLPIILMASYDDVAPALRAVRDMTVSAFVALPCTQATLTAAVAEVLEASRRRAHRQRSLRATLDNLHGDTRTRRPNAIPERDT